MRESWAFFHLPDQRSVRTAATQMRLRVEAKGKLVVFCVFLFRDMGEEEAGEKTRLQNDLDSKMYTAETR